MAASPEDAATDAAAIERRVWRNTIAVVVMSAVVSPFFASLRFTLGLALGGVLALVNYRWLHSSLRGILAAGNEKAPPGTTMKFIFRWLVIAVVGYAANRTGYFDAAGIVSGLFAPAAAVMIEAVYMSYKSL